MENIVECPFIKTINVDIYVIIKMEKWKIYKLCVCVFSVKNV